MTTAAIGAKNADLARQFAGAILDCERRGIYSAERRQWVENLAAATLHWHWTGKRYEERYRLPDGTLGGIRAAIAHWAAM